MAQGTTDGPDQLAKPAHTHSSAAAPKTFVADYHFPKAVPLVAVTAASNADSYAASSHGKTKHAPPHTLVIADDVHADQIAAMGDTNLQPWSVPQPPIASSDALKPQEQQYGIQLWGSSNAKGTQGPDQPAPSHQQGDNSLSSHAVV